MKLRVLLILLSFMMSTYVYASKARVLALQKAVFLKDVQTTFINPAHLHSLDKLMTFEFGGSTNTNAPKAEGGILDDHLGPKMGVYLGHISQRQKELRAINGFENQNNPIEVFYAKDNWGASVAISNYNDKTTSVKEKSLTARFGVDKNNTEYYATVEAFAEAESGADEFEGGPLVELGYEKAIGDNYFYGTFNWGTGENKITGVKTDADSLGAEVGALSRRIKNVYYGTALSYQKLKTSAAITQLTLPVYAGLEMDINSWAIVRASIVQSVLISQTQDKTQASPNNGKITNKNDTTVSAGLGLKYKDFQMDGVLAASTTGDVNGNAFLSQVSLTYSF